MENRPQKRQDGLIIRELDNEILIYDTENNKAHCLNQTAALVWKQCDGNTTTEEMSRVISRELGTEINERVVWFAIKQFNQDHLLEETVNMPAALLASGLNRRDVVRALGLAAVVAVPLVTSIVAPTAAQAATCLPSGSPCATGAQCCSGICLGTPLICG
jgi:Coenzyme PQQ synthesis protein D (PqqD)